MKAMRVVIVIATCAVLAATSSVAKANIVLLGTTAADAFIDLGGQGFGSAPRMLTLQNNTFESGSVTPIDQVHGHAIEGANKSTTPTLAALGWDTGADVGIGFNAGQTGNSGITLETLVLTIFNFDGTTVEGTFSLASPIDFTKADLDLQQGNGNSVFAFGLDAAQQAQFDTLLGMTGSSGFYAGLASSLGCEEGAPESCRPSNDGPDSFLGFDRGGPVSTPDGGSTIALLGLGVLGLGYVNRKMRA